MLTRVSPASMTSANLPYVDEARSRLNDLEGEGAQGMANAGTSGSPQDSLCLGFGPQRSL